MKQASIFFLLLTLLLASCDRDETAPDYWQPVKVVNNTSRIYSMTEVHFSSP